MIPNDRLLSISDRQVSVLDAFKAADQVLLSGVQGITDLITTPGLINLDFADVKSVMSGAGSALMGIGSARGDDRAVAAAEKAISSPLLEASIDGAHGVLLSIQGGSDLGLFEIHEAAQLVSNSAALDANIIFGAVIDDALGDEVRVTVIAAGFDESEPAGSGRPARQVTARRKAPTSSPAGRGSRSRRRTAPSRPPRSLRRRLSPNQVLPLSRAPGIPCRPQRMTGKRSRSRRRPTVTPARTRPGPDPANRPPVRLSRPNRARSPAACPRRVPPIPPPLTPPSRRRAQAGQAQERALPGCRTHRAPGARPWFSRKTTISTSQTFSSEHRATAQRRR